MPQGKTQIIVLSPEAEAFRQIPAWTEFSMHMVDDIYSIGCPKKWFVVYTNPKCEQRACKGIEDTGLGAYTPKAKDWRKQSRKDVHQKKPKIHIVRPLMARYAFVQLPVKETRDAGGRVIHEDIPFGLVRLIDGVKEIVGTPDGPICVSNAIVDIIREREDVGEFDNTTTRIVEPEKPRNSNAKVKTVVVPKWMDVGVEARMVGGPFNNFCAMIERLLPNERVKVGITVFGRSSTVEIGIESLAEAC